MSGAYRAGIDLTILEGVRRHRPQEVSEPTYPLTNMYSSNMVRIVFLTCYLMMKFSLHGYFVQLVQIQD